MCACAYSGNSKASSTRGALSSVKHHCSGGEERGVEDEGRKKKAAGRQRLNHFQPPYLPEPGRGAVPVRGTTGARLPPPPLSASEPGCVNVGYSSVRSMLLLMCF